LSKCLFNEIKSESKSIYKLISYYIKDIRQKGIF